MRFSVAVVCLVALPACGRHEPAPGYEEMARSPAPVECYPRPSTLVRDSHNDSPRKATAIRIRVFDERKRAVSGATVRLTGDSLVVRLTDDSGRVELPARAATQYRLDIRALGHNQLAAPLGVGDDPADSFIAVVPILLFDGPCSPAVWQKKPWWKWWGRGLASRRVAITTIRLTNAEAGERSLLSRGSFAAT